MAAVTVCSDFGDQENEICHCFHFFSFFGCESWTIKKQRDLFADKVHIVKAVGFPVVMYGCESWTVKKAEHQRTDAFELWCWRRLLRVPWAARKSNQSTLKEINPEYSLEGLMLKLKFQYFGYLMLSRLIGKDPNAGKDWGQKEKVVAEEETIR